MRLLKIIIVFLISECAGLDLEHNCSFQNEIISGKSRLGYPKVGDMPLLNRKIIGGTRVSILEHPYVVSIRRQTAHYLTGTLLGGNLVLTVAHAIVDVPIIELGVVVGQNYNDRGNIIFTVILVNIHQQFDRYTLQADLALLRVHELIDSDVRPGVKAIWGYLDETFSIENRSVSAFVTGWGRCDITGKELCLPRASVYYKDEFSDPMLRSINIDITQHSPYCQQYLKHEVKVGSGMLCVGPARQGQHTCPCLAAPGAPLVVNGMLLGVLSWGFGCGYHTDLPLIYSDIRYYNEWLWNNIKVFSLLSERHFELMFDTTRNAILNAWLTATRPNCSDHSHADTEIQPWKIDKELAQAEGNLFDIRDYFGKPDYHQEKLTRYELIRLSMAGDSPQKSNFIQALQGNRSWPEDLHPLVLSDEDTEYENDYDVLDGNPYQTPLVIFSNGTTTTESPIASEEYF